MSYESYQAGASGYDPQNTASQDERRRLFTYAEILVRQVLRFRTARNAFERWVLAEADCVEDQVPPSRLDTHEVVQNIAERLLDVIMLEPRWKERVLNPVHRPHHLETVCIQDTVLVRG